MSEATLKKEIVECFVIMPISNQNGYDNEHFTLVYEDIIKPAIQVNNMKPIRADETKNTNLIQLDILRRIIETPIAICDMSSKNPNVFYELGMRQAFDMPTVLIKDDETTAPFDISGLRYITYSKNMKHREVKSAVEELTKCIKETYLKKDDKSEINSLIRLMELTTPASFNSMNIPEAEKIERLQELELKDIKSAITEMSRNQNQLLQEFSILKSKSNKENIRSYNSPITISMNDAIKRKLFNIEEPPEIS
ncbi:hypothetical protein [Aliarcobacter butzleri]|uniref:hypothetical protein n=1 Tax=Aliarcobacter butzleri TaxID=28197 RepID=UPI00263E2A8F|nr:hypothetical protein [Aliarcobacter butzleri]MDN5112572.1 hypothetical protein [Aliarcobacter butzleri]